MAPQYRALTLNEAVSKAGARDSLEFLCDQRDVSSWDGSGTLKDLSGKGCDFVLGDTSGVDANDGTFYGPIGSRRRLSKISNIAGSGCVVTSSPGNTAFILSMSRPGAKWTWLQICTYEAVKMGNAQFANVNSVELSSKSNVADSKYLNSNLKVVNTAPGATVDEKQGALQTFINNPNVLGFDDGQCFSVVTLDAANGALEFYNNDNYEKIAFSMATADSATPAQPLRVGSGGNPAGGGTSFQTEFTFAAWSRALSPNEVKRIYRLLLPNYRFTDQRIA